MIKLKDILLADGSLPTTIKDILSTPQMELKKDTPEAVKDFWAHHKLDSVTAEPAEPDTYDFDDDMDTDPGSQLDDTDDEEGGYEPV